MTVEGSDLLGEVAFSPDGETWVEFGPAAARRRIGFHDYGAIYTEPGLYEQMFYETLGMRSTAEVVELYAAQLAADGRDPARERVIDFGAGNGIGGVALRALGVGHLVGVDLEPMARVAATRDRPDVYDEYFVGDLGSWSEGQLDALRAQGPTAMLALSAVGVGHIPPHVLQRAIDVLPAGGIYGFAVTPTLLPGSDDPRGLSSGFPDYLRVLQHETEQLAESSYVHRVRTDGTQEGAVAFLGRVGA